VWLTRYIEAIPLSKGRNLVFNFLSGDAVFGTDEEVHSLLTMKLDPESLDYWTRRGYIFENEEKEKEEVERLLSICSKLESSMENPIATIIPTYACNCKCTYCIEGTVTKRSERISETMIDAIFDKLSQIKQGVPNITLYGGEPLLRSNYEIVSYIFEKTKKAQGHIAIITNGTTLDHYLELLKKYSSILLYIQITIDGPKAIHDNKRMLHNGNGTFDMILDNISKVLEEVPEVHIKARTNVSKDDSISDLSELFSVYEERGFTNYEKFSYYLSPIYDAYGGCFTSTCIIDKYDFIYDVIDKLYVNNPFPERMNWDIHLWQNSLIQSILRRKRMAYPFHRNCGAGATFSYVFGPEGNLYACWEEVGISEKAIGRYYPDWHISSYGTEWRNRNFASIPKCRDCRFGFICRGGCGKRAERKNGLLNSPVCDCEENEKELLHRLVQKFIDPDMF